MENVPTSIRRICEYAFAITTLLLGLYSLRYAVTVQTARAYLLAFVVLGTGYDFFSAVVGRHVHNRYVLLWYARINFSLLCFGIVFTPMLAVFTIRAFAPDTYCALLADCWLQLLLFSLGFGSLFLFARYAVHRDEKALIFSLDKNHLYTARIFVARRVLLVISLLIALLAVIEGLQSSMALWSLLFFAAFAATVPLHIMHKHLSSMAAEFVTLTILAHGMLTAYPA